MVMSRRPVFLSHRGSLLLITLMFLTVLALLVTAFLFFVNAAQNITAGQEYNVKAFYLAEAGMNKAMWYLISPHQAPNGLTNGSWRTTAYPAAAGSGATDPRKETFADGSIYTMWVENYALDGSIYITAQSTVNGLIRTVYQRVMPGTIPVGWWKFDEATSGSTPTIAKDYGGNSYNGTLTGGPTWAVGTIGTGALYFNGTDDQYVSVNDADGLDVTTGLTIAYWFKKVKNNSAAGIVCKKNNSGNGVVWGIQSNGSDKMEMDVGNAGSTTTYYVTGSQKINDAIWHHYAVTYDATSKTASIYVDGSLDAAGQPGTIGGGSGTLWPGNLEASTGVLIIGKGLPGNRKGEGTVDDVRIYNRALSATEVLSLKNNGTVGTGLSVIPHSWGEK